MSLRSRVDAQRRSGTILCPTLLVGSKASGTLCPTYELERSCAPPPPAPCEPRNSHDAEHRPYRYGPRRCTVRWRQQIGVAQGLRKRALGHGNDLSVGWVGGYARRILPPGYDRIVAPRAARGQLRHAQENKRIEVFCQQRFKGTKRTRCLSGSELQQIAADLFECCGREQAGAILRQVVVHLLGFGNAAIAQRKVRQADRGEQTTTRPSCAEPPTQRAQHVDTYARAVHRRVVVAELVPIELVINTSARSLH